MKAATRRMVAERAGRRCEYCQLHEVDDLYTFHIEHVVAKQHGGSDGIENLAFSCHRCNAKKGPNLSGRLRATGEIVVLFNPRKQSWDRHFRWHGPILEGKTKAGIATILTLNLNAAQRVVRRELLIQAGEFPP